MTHDPTPPVVGRPFGSPRKRTLRRRIVLILAVILLLLGSWWLSTRPKTYRLICHLPCRYGNFFNDGTSIISYYSTQGVMPCLAGFCLLENECVISLRDWNTGNVKWRVTTAKPSETEWPSIDLQGIRNDYRVGISPNGRYLAVMTAAGSHARIQSWRDGVLTGEVRIKCELERNAQFEISTLDSGQSIFTINYYVKPKRATVMYLVEGGKIVAQGKFPYSLQLSPDGKSCFGFEFRSFYPVLLRDNVIRLGPPVKIDWGGNSFTFGANGTAFCNKTIYRLSGKQTAISENWTMQPLSFNGCYAALTSEYHARAIDMKTGKGWTITVPSRWIDGAFATVDGKHVFVLYREDSIIKGSLWRFSRPLARYLPDDRYWLVLYQRPNRVIALISVKDDYYDDDELVSRDTLNNFDFFDSW